MSKITDWVYVLDIDTDKAKEKIQELENKILRLRELQKEVGVEFEVENGK